MRWVQTHHLLILIKMTRALLITITGLSLTPVFAGDQAIAGGKAVVCETRTTSGKEIVDGKGVMKDCTPCEVECADAKNFEFEPLDRVEAKRLQWGFDLGAYYETNLFLSETFGQEGWVYSFAPEVNYRILGDDLTTHMLVANYGANLSYSDERDLGINHGGGMLYRLNTGRTIATARADYDHNDGRYIEQFTRFGDALRLREDRRNSSDRVSFTTSIDYELTACTALDFRYGFHDSSYDLLNDITTHGGQLAFLWGNRSRSRFGPYVGFERAEGQNQNSQEAFQVGASASWAYSQLTSFFGQAGFENRSYEGLNGAPDLETFVWSVGTDWHPEPGTSGRLSFDRRNSPSAALNNQTINESSVRLGLTRDLFSCYYGRFVGSYSWVDYTSDLVGGLNGGEEEYGSAYFELGRKVGAYGRVGLYYSLIENDSDVLGRSFQDDTLGFRYGASY